MVQNVLPKIWLVIPSLSSTNSPLKNQGEKNHYIKGKPKKMYLWQTQSFAEKGIKQKNLAQKSKNKLQNVRWQIILHLINLFQHFQKVKQSILKQSYNLRKQPRKQTAKDSYEILFSIVSFQIKTKEFHDNILITNLLHGNMILCICKKLRRNNIIQKKMLTKIFIKTKLIIFSQQMLIIPIFYLKKNKNQLKKKNTPQKIHRSIKIQQEYI
eukprot:TRINITY_DN3429_c1_g1_i7.p2 TRINITY_DN3429_c1_g1~~TRINITY_DN3429_c1_g1_i7.p2  ORF type:complete len:212 (-),score=-7.91 TRINITY_DN3429_c1_g1_i7:361-996(-)